MIRWLFKKLMPRKQVCEKLGHDFICNFSKNYNCHVEFCMCCGFSRNAYTKDEIND